MQQPEPYAESVVVATSPQQLYDLVSDVTRTGEWSPTCAACWWDEGARPQVGSWFTGRNETPARVWETRSQVVVADRGREFAWVVGGSWVRWSYLLEPESGGTRLTETWEVLPGGYARFAELYGDAAEEQLAAREQAARSGIPATLAALKRIAEGG